MRHAISRRALVLLIAAVAFGVSACGVSSHHAVTTTIPASADHNLADIRFATDMIPHHAGALEMSKLAATNADSAEVKALALQIQAAQQPEIDKMNQWLRGWGASTVDPQMSMQHLAHSNSMMPGMMSADDMTKLGSAMGSGFDKMFLQMMIEHHNGAIEMSRTEMSDGKSVDAKALAQSIEASQQKEVDDMQRLLTQLS